MSHDLDIHEVVVLLTERGDIPQPLPRPAAYDETLMSLRAKGYLTFGGVRLTPLATEALHADPLAAEIAEVWPVVQAFALSKEGAAK